MVEIKDEEVLLYCRASKKADQGKYTCTLKNEKGQDTASIQVIVVSAPAAPEGPLEVDDITPESMKLSWAPPKVGDNDLNIRLIVYRTVSPLIYFVNCCILV